MAERPAEAIPLDAAWCTATPLPQPEAGADKNARGRVLVLGGSLMVPGGVRLTAEAAFRAGAGKVQIGTVEPAAIALGVLVPEAAVLALPMDDKGEIDALAGLPPGHLARCNAVVIGPAMSCGEQAAGVLRSVLAQPDWKGGLVLDAAALMTLDQTRDLLRERDSPPILTPHIGEMAAMLDWDAERIAADRAGAVREAARRFKAVVALKGAATLIADPKGALFCYAGGTVGLATGGSGDVMAGIAGALAARGCDPLRAALWAVWLHGEAGRRCAETIGPLGFMARDLLLHIPPLMRGAASG